MNNWVHYQNGNYTVSLDLSTGTKIRENYLTFFEASFPENLDLKITDYCDAGCKFCHEGSTKKGKHANLNHQFLDTLPKYTELAIGGGNPLDHPELASFLSRMKEQKLVCNLTVNQIHFERQQELVDRLVNEELIYGLGVSLMNPSQSFITKVKQYKNAIIHTINGITSLDHYEKLSNNDLKILILGYKFLRRGEKFYSPNVIKNKQILKKNLGKLLSGFKVVSFDNLALDQLGVKHMVGDDYWQEFYMGDDGKFTMYVDLVAEEFASSSTNLDRRPLMSNIQDMFNVVKGATS